MLESLARGLRAAGGILSPGVYEVNAQEDLLAQRGAQAAALQERDLAARAADRADTRAFQHATIQDNRAARAAELQLRYQQGQEELMARHRQRIEELAIRQADAQTRAAADQQFRREMAEFQINARREMANFAASLRQPPAPSPLTIADPNDPTKSVVIDARTGQRYGNAPPQKVDPYREQAQIDRQVEGLSKRGDDIAALYAGINEVNKLIKPLVESGASLPGVGYGSNIKDPIFGLDISGPFIGEKGKNIRSAIQNVSNKILKAESGAAVTLPEQVRQDLANMATGNFSEADFLNAWPRIVAAMQANLDNIGASVRPEALKAYRERGGSLPFGQRIPVPRRQQESSGKITPPANQPVNVDLEKALQMYDR